MSYFIRLATERRSAKETRLLGLTPHFESRWDQLHHTYREGQLDQAEHEMRVQQLSEVLLAFVGAALYLADRVVGGGLSVGTYVILMQAVLRIQGETSSLTNLAREVYLLSLYPKNLFDFLERPPDASTALTGSRSVAGPQAFPTPLRDGIRFQESGFAIQEATNGRSGVHAGAMV